MGELIGTGIIAIVVVGGMIWLYVKANRSIKAQRGNRMVKRSQEERSAIRESNYRTGGDGFSGGGMA